MSKFIFAIVGCCCAFCLSGAEGWNRDSGLRAVEGDFTAAFTFRWHGYAPIPEKMDWRNGMIASHRSGYYDGWRVYLHDEQEGRPVFEIGRPEGGISIESGEGLSTGVWHRVVVSWQAATDDSTRGTMRLFADGALMAESAADRPRPRVDASPVMLGYVDFGVGALKLEVGMCTLAPRAWTTEDVAADYRDDPQIAADDPLGGRPLFRELVERADRQIADSAARREALMKTVSETPTTACVIANRDFEGDVLKLSRSAFSRVTDPAIKARFPKAVRERVLAVPVPEFPERAAYGVGVSKRCATLVFADGVEPLPQAVWPNGDCAAATAKDGRWRFDDPAAPRLAAGTKALGYGYWQYLWADAALPIEAAADGSYRLLQEHRYGLGDKPKAKLMGVPEVVDQPGEWCVVDGVLYLLPPEEEFRFVTIPQTKGPLFKAVGEKRPIVLRNVTFAGSLGTALELIDCADVTLDHVTFVGNCGDAAIIRNCGRVRILNSTFANTGFTQLNLMGGDRRTLTKGEMIVENCRFSRPGLLQRTYTPCILLEGCGGIVSRCTFSSTPSSAIRIEGNDHVVRDCRFASTVLESDDQGAIDIWGDPTYRGNLFYKNTFVNVGGDANHDCGRNAIRFDDFISGMAVVSNTFVNAAQGNFGAVNMNGGHYNLIRGNAFRNCALGIGGYGWGDKRMAERLATDELKGKLKILEGNPLYLKRYPELVRLGTDDAAWCVLDNRFRDTPQRIRHAKLTTLFR